MRSAPGFASWFAENVSAGIHCLPLSLGCFYESILKWPGLVVCPCVVTLNVLSSSSWLKSSRAARSTETIPSTHVKEQVLHLQLMQRGYTCGVHRWCPSRFEWAWHAHMCENLCCASTVCAHPASTGPSKGWRRWQVHAPRQLIPCGDSSRNFFAKLRHYVNRVWKEPRINRSTQLSNGDLEIQSFAEASSSEKVPDETEVCDFFLHAVTNQLASIGHFYWWTDVMSENVQRDAQMRRLTSCRPRSFVWKFCRWPRHHDRKGRGKGRPTQRVMKSPSSRRRLRGFSI